MVGFGLGKRAGRGALRLLKRPARVVWGLVTQRGMGPDVVVVIAPEGQLAAGIGQAVEDLLVQAFVAQAAVEALDVAILLRLARINVVPLDLVVVRPLQDRLTGCRVAVKCGTRKSKNQRSGVAIKYGIFPLNREWTEHEGRRR